MNLVNAFNFMWLYTSWPIIPKKLMSSYKGHDERCGCGWGLKFWMHAEDQAQMIVVIFHPSIPWEIYEEISQLDSSSISDH